MLAKLIVTNAQEATIDLKKLLPPFILLAAALGFWMADEYSPAPVSQDSESKDKNDTPKKEVSSNNGLLFKGWAASDPVPIKMLATWETDYGLMSLFKPPYSEGIDGFYYDSKTKEMDGMIRAEYTKNFLTGFWIQSTSDKKCDFKKFGTFYWGTLRFDIKEDRFLGKWGYCNEALGSNWNGKLLGPSS